MTSQEDLSDRSSGAETESDSPRSVDDLGHESAEGTEEEGRGTGLVEKRCELVETLKSRPLIVAAVVAGATAAAVIAAKIAYDRRQSSKGYQGAVRQLEDARDALIAMTSDLPERGRAMVHRVTNR